LNPFDAAILHYLNGFAHRSWNFDHFVGLVAISHLFKGAVPACLIWWAWFRKGEEGSEDREFLISGLAAAFLALLVARGLADTLPFRPRPIHDPAIHFQLPYGSNATTLIGWSSFPSDHAALFFALATGIYFVSRSAGILALCHALFIVCLPRIYLGYHYPTDILGGVVIGIGAATLLSVAALRKAAAGPAARWISRYPGASYAFLFFVTFQVSTNFDSVREVGHFLWSALRSGAIASR
jgi:membrane-associated phospholipid phosphatase